MVQVDSTSWSLVAGAAAREQTAADRFVRFYEPLVRRYLRQRWAGGPLEAHLEDALQEVFLECFKTEGLLDRAAPHTVRSFRALFLGLVRNVARRWEERQGRRREAPWRTGLEEEQAAREERLSRAFDRAWAQELLREALARFVDQARRQGPAALRRVELLRQRFYENRPIRELARTWDMDPVVLHRQYARARREFAAALRDVLRCHGLTGRSTDLLALLGEKGRAAS